MLFPKSLKVFYIFSDTCIEKMFFENIVFLHHQTFNNLNFFQYFSLKKNYQNVHINNNIWLTHTRFAHILISSKYGFFVNKKISSILESFEEWTYFFWVKLFFITIAIDVSLDSNIKKRWDDKISRMIHKFDHY